MGHTSGPSLGSSCSHTVLTNGDILLCFSGRDPTWKTWKSVVRDSDTRSTRANTPWLLNGPTINGLDWMGGEWRVQRSFLPACYTLGCEPVELDDAAMQWGPSMDDFGGPHSLLSTTLGPNGELQESQMPLLGCFNYPHSCWGHGYPIKG
jgi:hypothetical protein